MPSITLTPTSGNPGITITVKGTGFGKSQRIKMLVDKPNGAVKTYKCTLSGTFTGKVVTGSASSIGVHTVDITSTTSTTVLAHATFTLVAPTPPPPPPPPPPTVTITSGPTATGVTDTTASISWSLSENSTGQVEYGTTTSYGQLSTEETSYTYAAHVQPLSGLTPATLYHFRVRGHNQAGATYLSSDNTFTTTGATPPPPPPPPPPPTGTRRFTLPTTVRTVSPPSTIPSDGVTDCTNALQSWIDSVPNGSIIYFPAGAKFMMAGHGIMLNSRSDLIFDTDTTSPAEIRTKGAGINNSQFKIEASNRHITIRNLILKGDNPDVRTTNQFHAGQESSECLAMYGDNSYIEMDNVKGYNNWGHAIYLSRGGHAISPSFIWVHNCLFDGMGVMGIAIASATDSWFENNIVNDTAIYPFDFEDGQSGEPMKNIYVGFNQFNRWGWNSWYTGHCIVGDGSTGMSWDYVTIESNTLTGGFQSVPQNGQYGQISFIGTDTKNHLTIINNKGVVGAGPTVTLNNAPGAVVSGNTP